jgi:hypothetical protein
MCRQVATTIVLSHILKWVQTMPNLFGCMEILWYSDHDVSNMDKFSELARHVYLENVGIGPFDDTILQPKQ